ncbi:MAG: SdiA-regulated domain-containing protein [Rhodobacter sp.]|nr:SdiA-regulated domain-containing protein [Rhodobacter sp.]
MTHLVFKHRFDIKDEDEDLTEPSGLALAQDSPGYWTVSDNAKRIFRLDAAGQVLRSIKAPKKNLEGIAATPDGRLMSVREDPPQILVIDPVTEAIQRVKLKDMAGWTHALAQAFAAADNNGLEGITVCPDGRVLVVKEGKPGLLIEISGDLAAIEDVTELTAEQGFEGCDPDTKADFSGLSWNQDKEAVWIVSDKLQRAFLFGLGDHKVQASLKLGYQKGGKTKVIEKAEGIAYEPGEPPRLHIVSDKKAELYVFELVGG